MVWMLALRPPSRCMSLDTNGCASGAVQFRDDFLIVAPALGVACRVPHRVAANIFFVVVVAAEVLLPPQVNVVPSTLSLRVCTICSNALRIQTSYGMNVVVFQNKRKQGIPDLETAVPTQEALLGGIHVWRLHDHAEQLAAVRVRPTTAVALRAPRRSLRCQSSPVCAALRESRRSARHPSSPVCPLSTAIRPA